MSYILSPEQVRDLKWKRSFPKETKARIVPFYFKNNRCYFLLGKERFNRKPNRGLYNSLGGHREANETIFSCAKRELKEESIGVFDLEDFPIQKSMIIQRNRRFIIFVPFVGNTKEVQDKFMQRKMLIQDKKYDELSKIMGYEVNLDNIGYLDEIEELLWVPEYNIRGRHIYRSVIDVFQRVMFQNKNIGFNGFVETLKRISSSDYKLSRVSQLCFHSVDALSQVSS